MRRQIFIVLVAIVVGVIAINRFTSQPAPTPTETLGQRADRECAGKPDAAWCRDKILLQHAISK